MELFLRDRAYANRVFAQAQVHEMKRSESELELGGTQITGSDQYFAEPPAVLEEGSATWIAGPVFTQTSGSCRSREGRRRRIAGIRGVVDVSAVPVRYGVSSNTTP